MEQLTVRGLDADLDGRLRQLARERGVSLNEAALLLLRTGVGLDPEGGPGRIGTSLDHLVGAWTAEGAADFMTKLEPFGAVDEHHEN